MAVVLVIGGRECEECGMITFGLDRIRQHTAECNRDRRASLPAQNFVLPIEILSTVDPMVDEVDEAKFTIRYDWGGRTMWREVIWPS